MFSALHLLYAVVHAIFAIWAIKLYRQQQHIGIIFLIVIALGLAYDNTIIGLGATLGVGETLAGLSIFRFVIHALFTPLLIITGLYIAQAQGVRWTQKPRSQQVLWVIVGALIVLGAVQSLIGMELLPACQSDVVRYTERLTESQICTNVTYAEDVLAHRGMPPLASIFTILVLIVLGGFVRRASKWSWLLIGSVLMFIAAAIPASRVGLWVGNGGEVILIAAITVSIYQLRAMSVLNSEKLAGADTSPVS